MKLLGRLLLLFTMAAQPVHAEEYFGRYDGTVHAEWLADGRRMRLLHDFGYTDPNAILWTAPRDSIVDGASIPRILWTPFGAPFTGTYRDASVIHDVACQSRTRTWELVHLAFYYAMRASGVSEARSRMAYAAVYHLGPRWQMTASYSDEVAAQIQMDLACEGEFCTPMDPGSVYTIAGDTITVTPATPNLSEEEVERLMGEIEAAYAVGQSVTLEEIRSRGQ